VDVAIVSPDDRLAFDSQKDFWKRVGPWQRLVNAAHPLEFT